MELLPDGFDEGPDGYYTFEWLFLAMAHWQLGGEDNRDRARALYHQAVAMMQQEVNERPAWIHRLKLEFLREEAADLLGIDDETSSGDHQNKP